MCCAGEDQGCGEDVCASSCCAAKKTLRKAWLCKTRELPSNPCPRRPVWFHDGVAVVVDCSFN